MIGASLLHIDAVASGTVNDIGPVVLPVNGICNCKELRYRNDGRIFASRYALRCNGNRENTGHRSSVIGDLRGSHLSSVIESERLVLVVMKIAYCQMFIAFTQIRTSY